MTVTEIITALSQLKPDAVVAVSIHIEGEATWFDVIEVDKQVDDEMVLIYCKSEPVMS